MLRDREKVKAEGVRITLLEGMRPYLIYLWIECGIRLCFAFYSPNQGELKGH